MPVELSTRLNCLSIQDSWQVPKPEETPPKALQLPASVVLAHRPYDLSTLSGQPGPQDGTRDAPDARCHRAVTVATRVLRARSAQQGAARSVWRYASISAAASFSAPGIRWP